VKKRNFLYHSFVLLAMFCSLVSPAQKAVDAITQPFDAFRSQNLQEKLFVHTDKGFYMAGEIIWFKVYAVDAVFNKPLDLSKISYVELLTKEHKPVLQAKIAMNAEATGNGSFQLPYSVNSGTYILRAYTSWMKNAGADYYFEKDISIVNGLKKPDWPVKETAFYDVQFFPEGGNLVKGIQSRIAFRIVDAQGKSVGCKGAVINQRNDTVARFSTLRFGMGHFDLTPDAGEQYQAVIKTNDGTVINRPLPVVNTSGTVMRLTDMGNDKLSLSIQSSQKAAAVSLLVHTRQLQKVALTRELFNGKTEIEIDKKELGEGISHFTVFNSANQPVCERLFFKRPETLSLAVRTDAQNYGKRKKVTIDLSAGDAKQLPAQGNLSMAVYMLDPLQSFESSDILSYFWLQSDLRGNIESPAYYFSEPAAEVSEAADNLMLTQGWRRFTWGNVFDKQNHEPEYLPETEGHIITGKLIDKRNGQPAANVMAYISVPAEKSLFSTATSTKNGMVRFNLKNFYGGNDIVVQPVNIADSMYRIDIANPFSEKYTSGLPGNFTVTEKDSALLLTHNLQAQVSNAYYADKQQNFLYPKNIDTMPFYGVPDHRYYLDDYTRFITMEEVMREYVADVRVRKNNDHFSYRVNNTSFNTLFETPPLVLIDGVPVFDVDKIISFDPLKIKRIDVMSQKVYQHNITHDGVINYSTYQGDLAGYTLDANALIVEYEGLQLQREFFSPVYETAEALNSRLPDFRNLLYWSPEIHTGKDGKKQVSFYTADIPGSYGVVIQGITANGLAGSKTAIFTVNK
jgi:hypothetical protein